MKRTYTATLMLDELSKATIELHVYGQCKYTSEVEDAVEVSYTGVTAYDLIGGGREAEEIERESDEIDDFHEYLVLHFEDGTTSTFRNSYVDMYIR